MKFIKDPDNRWYVDLPEWTGERWELEMVEGADTLCDILAQGDSEVNVQVGLEPIEGAYKLTKIRNTEELGGGATYNVTGGLISDMPIWLCHVTAFVFGFMPETIYMK